MSESRGIRILGVAARNGAKYCSVFEKHENGYGHIHVAAFVDGVVNEADFHSVIDEHLFQCDIANKDAHGYHSPNPDDRPIFINRINPDAESKGDGIQNLGSYIGEYIGAYGKELFERELSEIIFRAVCWATGTQVVRFSNGANEMIRESRPDLYDDTECDGPEVCIDPETETAKVESGGWDLKAIGQVDRDGETQYQINRSGVTWVQIDGAESLDPPAVYPADLPQTRHDTTTLENY